MAVTVRQVEADPGGFIGIDGIPVGTDLQAIWRRVEGYVAHRWITRAVVWTVEGEGDWTPPLVPATVEAVEVWEGGGWSATTLPEGPYGWCLPGDGPYRITATVGGGPVPPVVLEAVRRLALYLGDSTDRAAASSYSVNMGGAIEESYERNPAWIARAMDLSGAADLLRPYRRAS